MIRTLRAQLDLRVIRRAVSAVVIAITSGAAVVSCGSPPASPETRTEMSFENIDVRALEEGSFVYSSGEVSDRPCDMSAGGG